MSSNILNISRETKFGEAKQKQQNPISLVSKFPAPEFILISWMILELMRGQDEHLALDEFAEFCSTGCMLIDY